MLKWNIEDNLKRQRLIQQLAGFYVNTEGVDVVHSVKKEAKGIVFAILTKTSWPAMAALIAALPEDFLPVMFIADARHFTKNGRRIFQFAGSVAAEPTVFSAGNIGVGNAVNALCVGYHVGVFAMNALQQCPRYGVTVIAQESGSPIIPVCINGEGLSSSVRFGKPIVLESGDVRRAQECALNEMSAFLREGGSDDGNVSEFR